MAGSTRDQSARGRSSASLNTLTASEIVRAVASGEATCEAVVRACLARIAARENDIHAWASIDPELALAQARELDRGPPRGPLHGVPIGVKDIIDTADLPTEMGSPIYRGHRPTTDAACVALARAAGAVILGKTVTCEFAGMTPGATTNPHDIAHTPGGSSSGSGAAVADFMVPAAFGTQTGGSVLRPAAYCGVFGFKPTFGAFNRRGVYPAAESLDTLGLIARSLDDIELLSDGAGTAGALPGSFARRVRPASGSAARRCGRPRSRKPWPPSRTRRHGWTRPAHRCARSCCRKNSPGCATLRARPSTTTSARRRWRPNGSTIATAISERLRKRIEIGRAMPHAEYVAALRLGEDCRARLPAVFDGADVLLAPCTTGEAPRGLAETGDPGFQAIWTILHTPALTLPTHRGPNGLPVGIQLVAERHADRKLLACARWIWQRLGSPDMVGTRG